MTVICKVENVRMKDETDRINLSKVRISDWPPVRSLSGHSGAVTCLLYPHEEHPRYEPHHLLSGGADFAVFLWDLSSGTRIHRFCVQAGPILRLLIPPENCNVSVMIDGAFLSLKIVLFCTLLNFLLESWRITMCELVGMIGKGYDSKKCIGFHIDVFFRREFCKQYVR